jgi:predicted kinase
LISKFRYQKELFKYVQIQSEADSNGRYYNEEVVNSPGHHKEMTQEEFNEIFECIASEKPKLDTIGRPTCKLLIGAPLSGKSTYLVTTKNNEVVVSRDAMLMEYGYTNNLGSTYSEIWNNLSEADQKLIDVATQTKFNTAVKNGQHIIIDMTNMSAKSRNRWVSNLPKNYIKEAVVLFTSYKTLVERNEIRNAETGKFIPEYVLKNMSKSFAMPMYNEFDRIQYIFNGVVVKD